MDIENATMQFGNIAVVLEPVRSDIFAAGGQTRSFIQASLAYDRLSMGTEGNDLIRVKQYVRGLELPLIKTADVILKDSEKESKYNL